MTKTEIYNIALRQHGKRCTSTEVNAQTPPYEVQLCIDSYNGAVHRVLGEFDWSSYTVPVFYDPEYDFPEGGWQHGYLLPQGILRIIQRSTQPYQLIGTKFLTNEEHPDIYAIMDTFDCETASDDICNLIGLAIAYELCGILSPADNAVMQMILQKYSWTSQPMIKAEAMAYERTVEEGGAVSSDTIPYYKPTDNSNHRRS